MKISTDVRWVDGALAIDGTLLVSEDEAERILDAIAPLPGMDDLANQIFGTLSAQARARRSSASGTMRAVVLPLKKRG